MREEYIEMQILDYLTEKGFFAWKNANSGTYDRKRKIYRSHNNKYAIRGVSDIIAVRNGQTFFIEVKNNRGVVSEYQELFAQNILINGGFYLVVRSVLDVKRYFKLK